MEKDNIRIQKVIVHILDSLVGIPVLSDSLIEHGSDFSDFLREHIYKILSGDDIKPCSFLQEESEVYQALTHMSDENFISVTKQIAAHLYKIMNSNIAIPPADLLVVLFSDENTPYLALLKMNYKTSYTHQTHSELTGNINDIIKYKSILPTESQRLQEAAIIQLKTYDIKLLEKKYEINGIKTNYFSQMFLQCADSMSNKTKLSIVTRAVEAVQSEYLDEDSQFNYSIKAKAIIHEELSQNGGFHVSEVAGRIFETQPELKADFHERIEKYHLQEAEIIPQNEATIRKFQKQCLTTDSGIEIKIPMSEYHNTEQIEFITNADGTVSVLIKHVSLRK